MKMLQVFLLLLFFCNFGQTESLRRVDGNVLISDSLPAIKIQISKDFRFLGSFPFRIGNIAAGDRFIFAEEHDGTIRRMLIAQFESFLPESTEIYRYSFDDAISLSGFRFRQNTFAFSFKKDVKENPRSESAATLDFLRQKNLNLTDEWMSSRFLTLGDESRRSEMILFYMEPVASTGHHLTEFYKEDSPTELWKRISKELEQRSRASFEILTK